MQLRIHSGSCLRMCCFFVPASMSVKCVHNLSSLVGWWTKTLCLAILSPLRNLFSLKERSCGHVSLYGKVYKWGSRVCWA